MYFKLFEIIIMPFKMNLMIIIHFSYLNYIKIPHKNLSNLYIYRKMLKIWMCCSAPSAILHDTLCIYNLKK